MLSLVLLLCTQDFRTFPSTKIATLTHFQVKRRLRNWSPKKLRRGARSGYSRNVWRSLWCAAGQDGQDGVDGRGILMEISSGYGSIRENPWQPCYIYIYRWVNYNDLTATSLEIMVSKGNHPQMALVQVSELLLFAQIDGDMAYGSMVIYV